MKLIRSILLLALINLAALSGNAQVDKKLEKANKLYDQLAFVEAIELYQQILQEREVPEAVIKIANSYRLMNKPALSEPWYKKVMDLSERQPIHVLYYAQSLQSNEKYKEAKIWYEKYDGLAPDDRRGYFGKTACEKVDEIIKMGQLYSIYKLPSNINTVREDFGPAYYYDGIAWASDRDATRNVERVFQWTGTPFLNIFTSKKKNEQSWEEPDQFSGSANTEYHDGPVTFNSDFSKMFFTRSNYDEGSFGGKVHKSEEDIVKLKIMYAEQEGNSGKWKAPQEMPFNNVEYSVAHPSLTADGKKLYFVGDDKFGKKYGGKGGNDIYYTIFDGNSWSNPVNLGDVINTKGDEMFPFIAHDSTLYFASNAHPGLGGLDIFSANMNKENGGFENVRNLGAPLNSSRDDFSLIIDKNNATGYFTSNRERGDDDIYAFNSLKIFLEILVVDKVTDQPIPGATVNLSDRIVSIGKDTTDINGKTYYVIERNKEFSAMAEKPTYFPNTKNFDSHGMKGGEKLKIKIPLERSMVLVLEGNVLDKHTLKPIDKADVKLINKNNNQEQTTIVGPDGFFRFPLVPDAEYYLTGSKPEYVYDELTFNTFGKTKSEVIHKDLYLERLGGSPIVLRNIYYDFDRSNIREDASTDLFKLLRIMRENAAMIVEIGSHTDSRGSFKYNEGLSQRRAESAINWLVAKGIERDRMIARGYGEYYPTNECVDLVPCNEVQHQRNRRSELKVISFDGKTIVGSERYTEPNDYYIPGGKYPEGRGSTNRESSRYRNWSINQSDIEVVRPEDVNPDSKEYIENPPEVKPGQNGGKNLLNQNDNNNNSNQQVEVADNTPEEKVTEVEEVDPNSGTKFRVQFAAKLNENSDFNAVSELGNIQVEHAGVYYRYLLGNFKSKKEAEGILKKVKDKGYSQAYVVKYVDGERKNN